MKYFNPITPSIRHLVQIDRSILSKKKDSRGKFLRLGLHKQSGRNHQGIITVRRRGGGHKKSYRIIDFKKQPTKGLQKETFVVQGIEYDPNRTSFIALIQSEYNNQFRYIISPEGLDKDDRITFYSEDVNSSDVTLNSGNSLPLSHIPVGTQIYDVELKPGKGSQLVRSAGTSAVVIQQSLYLNTNGPVYTQIRLPSNEMRLVLSSCHASAGSVSNVDHQNVVLGKAGRNRWLGKRPRVRGVAMNPVDHPHGGGEGKTSGGRPSVTPRGIPTRGKRTRSKAKSSRLILSKSSNKS